MNRFRAFFFTNQNTKQIVIKNTVWVGASTIVMKLLRAAILIYAARLLGTEGYGIFNYALSIAGIAAMFSDMGLSALLTRELIQGKQETRGHLATSIVVKAIFITVVILLIALAGPALSQFEGAKVIMPVLAFSIAFESIRNFLYAISRSQNNMQTEAGIGFATELVSTVLVLGVFFNAPSAYTLALAYMIGNAIGFVITIVALRKHLFGFWHFIDTKQIVPIMQASLPFAVMGIFGILMTNIDAVILGFFGNETLLGLYGAAQRPISVLYIIPAFLNTALLPIMSKFATPEKEGRLRNVVRTSLVVSSGVALPIIVGGMIVAKPFINAAFGFEYVGAALTLQVLLTSLLFSFPAAVLSDMLLAQDRKNVLVRASIIGAIANVVLDVIFIPRFGIAGSAVATVAAQAAAWAIFYVAIRKSSGHSPLYGTKKIVAATLCMGAITVWLTSLSIPLLVILPVSAIVYALALFVLKEKVLLDFLHAFRS